MNETSQTLPTVEVVRLVCKALDGKKAENLVALYVGAQSSITDYLVVATGTSEPHLRALRVELEKVLDAAKARILGMDTDQGSGWMVVDAFDVMIHLFTTQTRETYKLESLWKDAEALSMKALLSDAPVAAGKKASISKVASKRSAPKKHGLKPEPKKRSAKKVTKKAGTRTGKSATKSKTPKKAAAPKKPAAKKPVSKK